MMPLPAPLCECPGLFPSGVSCHLVSASYRSPGPAGNRPGTWSRLVPAGPERREEKVRVSAQWLIGSRR